MCKETADKFRPLWIIFSFFLMFPLIGITCASQAQMPEFNEWDVPVTTVGDSTLSPDRDSKLVLTGKVLDSDLERLPEPISGAQVVLFEDGIAIQAFDEQSDGKYTLLNFSGTPGKSYHVNVMLPDGRTFASNPEIMPALTGTDHVYYSFQRREFVDAEGTVSEQYFLDIFTSHTLPVSTQPVYLRWHTEEVYVLSPTDFPDPFGDVPPSCYIDQQVEPQRINLFSTESTNTTKIPELQVVSRLVDPSFKERHYFTVYQSSLTRQAFKYWQNVDVVANQTGSIFDPPPALLKGNIRNVADAEAPAHGYFQAVNQVFTRFYLLPADLPIKLPLHCEFRPEKNYYDYPSECLNCSSLRNSSYNRPSWF